MVYLSSPVLNPSPAPCALIRGCGGIFRTLSFLQHAFLFRSARRTVLWISNNKAHFTLYRGLGVAVWDSHNSKIGRQFLFFGDQNGILRDLSTKRFVESIVSLLFLQVLWNTCRKVVYFLERYVIFYLFSIVIRFMFAKHVSAIAHTKCMQMLET